MTLRLSACAGAALFSAALAAASATAPAPPTLKVPGRPDQPVTAESLLGRDQRDVRLEDSHGDVTIYHGRPLLEVLEKGGLDLKTMAGERETAAAVVVAIGRDGYTVVFSVGELIAARSNPKVYLVSDKDGEALPENEGLVRLVVYGDVVRSAYGLATIELRYLAKNKR
jgi:hypothetical protein